MTNINTQETIRSTKKLGHIFGRFARMCSILKWCAEKSVLLYCALCNQLFLQFTTKLLQTFIHLLGTH